MKPLQRPLFHYLVVCLMGLAASRAQAEGKVKLMGLSLNSEECVKTLKDVLEKVDGVSKLSFDLKGRTATAILRDKKAARALDKALKEAGFNCNYDFEPEVLDVALTFTQVGRMIGSPAKPKAITIKNVHVCCAECEKAIAALFKDAKVTFEGKGPRKTVRIVGKNLDYSKVGQTLGSAGYNPLDFSGE